MSEHTPPEDPPIFAFFNEVSIIDQLATNVFASVLPDGLQPSHFAMLNHMVRMGDGWSPARLAAAFQITKGAVTNTLGRLEARGLARVEPDPEDGRKKRVFITEEGRAMRETCIQALAPLLVKLQGALGEEVFREALPGLRQVRAFLDQARD